MARTCPRSNADAGLDRLFLMHRRAQPSIVSGRVLQLPLLCGFRDASGMIALRSCGTARLRRSVFLFRHSWVIAVLLRMAMRTAPAPGALGRSCRCFAPFAFARCSWRCRSIEGWHNHFPECLFRNGHRSHHHRGDAVRRSRAADDRAASCGARRWLDGRVDDVDRGVGHSGAAEPWRV